MKNIFFSSNTQNDLFPSNTRSSFRSYIDANDLHYIPNKHLLAALKSITFDNKISTLKLNYKEPNIIIVQTNATFSWENYEGPMQRTIGPAQFKFGRDYIYINDLNELNDRFGTPGYRSFTDIQIVEGEWEWDNNRWNVLHNIYFNDVILHSTSHLITYLNEVFENINYPFVFGLGAHNYNRKIFQNGVLERHDFDIYFSKQIGDMLGLDGIKLHKYSTIRELADMHLPAMTSWTPGVEINKSLNAILDRKGEYIYYKVLSGGDPIKLIPNFNISKPHILGVRSTICEHSITNNTYDRIIGYINAKDLQNDTIHITFNNPIYYSTTKEKLSQAHFELIDINTNESPSTHNGTPTYIQIAVKSEHKMKQTFSIFLDSSDVESKKIYNANSNMSFTTKLPERMEFRRNWEISMQGLFIPSKLNNIYEDTCWFETAKVKERDMILFRKKIVQFSQPINIKRSNGTRLKVDIIQHLCLLKNALKKPSRISKLQ